MELSQGSYKVQNLNLTSLAGQFGTPVYVYDANRIIQQLKTLKTAFSNSDVKIKYAAKALTNLSILRLLKKYGSDVDVVSIQEAQLAIRAGFTPSQIMYTPSGVDFAEIVEAVDLRLTVNLDNLPSLQKFGEKYKDSYPCSIRLNPHIMAGGNYKISTGHSNSKFGISVFQLPEIHEVV